tara:strand:- start:1844 stop:2128 length:285 start_codon:yes stop_codon:yes gene_type:complete
MAHKIVNGVQVELTAVEVTAMEEQAVAWKAGEKDRLISNIRSKRNSLLKETDYLALSDNTLSDEMRSYRQELRDITQGVTSLTKAKAVVFPVKP